MSPGFTELDEVQDLELRKRVWREFITDAREEGDPDVAALLEADIKLKDLDSAFATVCDNDDVEFPPGEVECPDPKRAAKALEEFWKKFQKHMPASIHEDTKCGMLIGGAAVLRASGAWRRSGSIDRRSSRPCSQRGTASPRSR